MNDTEKVSKTLNELADKLLKASIFYRKNGLEVLALDAESRRIGFMVAGAMLANPDRIDWWRDVYGLGRLEEDE